MIHDCGSFRWYLLKPMLLYDENRRRDNEGLVPLGRACMQQWYYAFEEEDIIIYHKYCN